jgi:hypothetical protein
MADMFIALTGGMVSGLRIFGIAIVHRFGNQSEFELCDNVVIGKFCWCFVNIF